MNMPHSISPEASIPKGGFNLETINIKYNYGAAIVELWKKYALIDALNRSGCKYRKLVLVKDVMLNMNISPI